MNYEILEKAGKLAEENSVYGGGGEEAYVTLALIDANGYPSAATITPSRSVGIRQMTFCTGLETNWSKRIAKCSRASVCINRNGAYNITLVGTIAVITDPAVKREMWYEGMGEHFSGPDDLAYCVLRFRAERYSLFIEGESAAGETGEQLEG